VTGSGGPLNLSWLIGQHGKALVMDEVGIGERAADLLQNLNWGDSACPGIGILQERLGAHDVHLLSACCQWRGLMLGQQAVPETTSELGAIGAFLARLPLAGETVTFDAEFTRWLVATRVVAHGGAYLLVAKHNQPTLRRACVEARRWQSASWAGRLSPSRSCSRPDTRMYSRAVAMALDGLAVLRIIRTPQPHSTALNSRAPSDRQVQPPTLGRACE